MKWCLILFALIASYEVSAKSAPALSFASYVGENSRFLSRHQKKPERVAFQDQVNPVRLPASPPSDDPNKSPSDQKPADPQNENPQDNNTNKNAPSNLTPMDEAALKAIMKSRGE